MNRIYKYSIKAKKPLFIAFYTLTSLLVLFNANLFAAGEDSYQKTLWSDKTELFMEYDQPEVGKLGGFLLHLTNLETFKPLSEVKVKLSITSENGKTIAQQMPFSGRPGIFKGTLAPSENGKHRFNLEIIGKDFNDKLSYENFIVKAKGKRSVEGGQHDAGPGGIKIPFLKEQQWAVDFNVILPEKRNMPPILSVSGELSANPSSIAIISAPLAGMIAFDKPLAHLGQRVVKGEELCHIEPPVSQEGGADKLASQVTEARNRVLLAKKELDRARLLVEGKAAPRKRLEEAEIMLKIAQSNLVPLEKALSRIQSVSACGHTILKAPISGSIVSVNIVNGAYMQAGQPLLKIVDTSSLWLTANVPVAEISHSEHLSSAYFTVTGNNQEFRPSRLINVSEVVDPTTRTVQTIFEVKNPESKLKIGMFASVFLQNGFEENNVALAVPNSAVFEDEGKHFVYVQLGGEVFTRREVTVGNKAFGLVAIDSGLAENERVVSKGGYYVKQASQSSKTPEGHGHEH